MKVNRDYLLKNVTIRVVTVAGKGGACGSIVAEVVVLLLLVVVVVAAVFLFLVVVAVVTPSKIHLPDGILETPRYLGLQLP